MRSVFSFSAMAVALAMSSSAYAVSFDLGVTGTITPAACVPSVGSSTIALGTIPTETLSADSETVLPLKNTSFSITCDAPVKVALKATDNRSGTVITPSKNLSLFNDSILLYPGQAYAAFGLGTDGDDNKIGLWVPALNVSSISTDTDSSVDVLYTSNDGISWGKISLDYAQISNATGGAANSMKSFAKTGELTPMAFTTLSGTIAVQPVIAPTSALDLSEAINLNGSATIELVYL